MLPDLKVRCPATGFAKSCHSIITKFSCPKWISVKGTDPQTGAVVDSYGCVDSFLPMLLIENAQQQRQTAAAVESFRNEVVRANEQAVQERSSVLDRFAPEGPRRLTG